MCADNAGSDLPEAGECPECGSPIDRDGDSLEICNYSQDEPCIICGNAPCDESC